MNPEQHEPRTVLQTPNTNIWGRLVGLLIAVLVVSGGGSAVWKYLNRNQIPHDKLTKVHYHGGWSPGEYQDCNSMNLKEEDTAPELYCSDSSLMDPGKLFKVRFSGDFTYDEDKQEGTSHSWRCRNNGDADVTFTCSIKEK